MMEILLVWWINLWHDLGNLWRRMLRRRVTHIRIELHGSLPEFVSSPVWWQRRFLGRREPLSLSRLRRQFTRIAADPQVRGVLLHINGLTAGWATLQSLRDEIRRLREAGKKVSVYLRTPDVPGYYAACAANEILMPPATFFSIVGLHIEVQFLKDALEKIGISAEVTAVSPFKSGGDTLVRSDMSPENRAQLERLLDARYHEVVRAIGEARGMQPDAVCALIDQAPFNGPVAVEHGLIDGLYYEDQLVAHFKDGETDPIILDWGDATRALRLLPVQRYKQVVAVIPIEGTIVDGPSRNMPLPLPLFGGTMAGAESIAQALRKAERNRRIGAVILYVNSPGGSAFASDQIWREVVRVGRKKPVVVAMGDAAASGGYYVAAPAAAIIAQPGTLTGSIGVFVLRPILEGLLERVGVHTVALSRGANSGFLNSSAAPTDAERQALRDLVFTSYAEFKARVREGRSLSEEHLEPIAGGRVWVGREAMDLGLVDQMGGIPEALLKAQELAGMPRDREAPLPILRGGRSHLAPEPFPPDSAAIVRAIQEALRPQIWMALPWDII